MTTVLDTLASEGVLGVTTVPHSTARAYELVDVWRPSLLAAIAAEAPRGQLEPERRLLLVGSRDAAAFARAAATLAANPAVLWAARVDGPVRLLVVLRADTVEQRDRVDRLEATLAGEGLDCMQLRIDRLMELDELARYARELTRRPRPPAGELVAG